MTAPRYDQRTIKYHWLSAALVIGLWVVGECIDFFPKDLPRIFVRSLHITLGLTLGLVTLARLGWRRRAGVKFPAEEGALGKVAIGVHHLLYVLVLVIVVVGIAAVWIRGDNLFNLFTVPAFDPGNKELRHNVVEVHGLLANILLAVVGLHAAAAIWHHHIKKDEILTRMLPRRR